MAPPTQRAAWENLISSLCFGRSFSCREQHLIARLQTLVIHLGLAELACGVQVAGLAKFHGARQAKAHAAPGRARLVLEFLAFVLALDEDVGARLPVPRIRVRKHQRAANPCVPQHVVALS